MSAPLPPPPEDCSLVNVVRLNPTGFYITCNREGETGVADYVGTLKVFGFAEKDRVVSDHHDLVIK